jgi:uncharacterized protein
MRRDVEFKSEGETIRAHLYTPDGQAGPHPTVVMAGGWCYVKELVQPHYAAPFVEAGFACLIFDYRRLGASDGLPRQHLDPWDQIEDYKNAISFAETLEEVDSDRIGVWGISYSGGHVLVVGATDPRVKCIVSNIPVVDGWFNMRRAHGTVGFRRLQSAIVEDRRKRFATGEYGTMPMSADPAEALATWPFPETGPIFLDIKEREAPAHEHWNTVASTENLLSYDVRPYLERILNTPVMMIVAEQDDLTMWEKEIPYFQEIPSPRKEIFVVGDTTHMTLYSDKGRLQIAAEQARDFMLKYLAPTAP